MLTPTRTSTTTSVQLNPSPLQQNVPQSSSSIPYKYFYPSSIILPQIPSPPLPTQSTNTINTSTASLKNKTHSTISPTNKTNTQHLSSFTIFLSQSQPCHTFRRESSRRCASLSRKDRKSNSSMISTIQNRRNATPPPHHQPPPALPSGRPPAR